MSLHYWVTTSLNWLAHSSGKLSCNELNLIPSHSSASPVCISQVAVLQLWSCTESEPRHVVHFHSSIPLISLVSRQETMNNLSFGCQWTLDCMLYMLIPCLTDINLEGDDSPFCKFPFTTFTTVGGQFTASNRGNP